MDPALLSVLLGVLGAGLGSITKLLEISRQKRQLEAKKAEPEREKKAPMPAEKKVLLAFSVVVIVFGAFTLARYWDSIKQNMDMLIFALWLFVTIIAGMFVQVLASNYRNGKPLFEVTGSQLAFPMLFSLVVFYGIGSDQANRLNL